MATLKGQNFRILTYHSTTERWQVIGMATNCTINLTNNIEEASHKEVVGMAAMPEVVSQGWSVQVESLNVADVGAMLTAIKNNTPFTLHWDETSTSDNQALDPQTYGRQGSAYLNDGTFTFDNRTNSTKSLQFTGTGAITAPSEGDVDEDAFSGGSFTKGQFVRLFLGSDNTAAPTKVIASATSLSLHVSVQLEEATTKDTEGNWQIQEPTGLSYDISTSALVRGNDTITSTVAAQGLSELESIFEAGTPVKWFVANVSGANQRTAGTKLCSGSCIVQSLTLNGPNRQNATYDASLAGYGPYTVGA